MFEQKVSKIQEVIPDLFSLGRKGTIYFLEGCWHDKNLLYPGLNMNGGVYWISQPNYAWCWIWVNRSRGTNTIGISLFSYLCSFLYASFIFPIGCLCEAETRAPGSSRLHSYCLINNEKRESSASINKENPRGK